MKKAIKQWKKWLFETARTEKWSDDLEGEQQDPKGDQPRIKHRDPAKAIEPIIKMMSDIQMVNDYIKTEAMPQSINTKDVLRYYISQNISQEDAPQPSTSNRFSRQLGFTPDQLAMMNKAAFVKKKRK